MLSSRVNIERKIAVCYEIFSSTIDLFAFSGTVSQCMVKTLWFFSFAVLWNPFLKYNLRTIRNLCNKVSLKSPSNWFLGNNIPRWDVWTVLTRMPRQGRNKSMSRYGVVDLKTFASFYERYLTKILLVDILFQGVQVSVENKLIFYFFFLLFYIIIVLPVL